MSYAALADAQLVNAGITQDMLDQATLYLDSRYTWPGVLADTTQAENWPRESSCGDSLHDANGRELVGIPAIIVKAETQLAALVLGGDVLLPSVVAKATSSSNSSTVAGGELIEKTVKSGDEQVTNKWSSSSTSDSTSTTVADFDDNGLPIIASIDALLKPITDIGSIGTAHNFYFVRA